MASRRSPRPRGRGRKVRTGRRTTSKSPSVTAHCRQKQNSYCPGRTSQVLLSWSWFKASQHLEKSLDIRPKTEMWSVRQRAVPGSPATVVPFSSFVRCSIISLFAFQNKAKWTHRDLQFHFLSGSKADRSHEHLLYKA